MTKEQMIALAKYVQVLKDRASTPVPLKHVNRPEAYKAFLQNELKLAQSKLDREKLLK